MNATNLINLYATWYKDLDIRINELWYSIEIEDKRNGSVYYINSMDAITRTFRDLGNMRKACGVL